MVDLTPKNYSRKWTGLPVCEGTTYGVVHVLRDDFDEPEAVSIKAEQVESELNRLNQAIVVTRHEIEALKKMVIEEGGEAEADIFDAHLLILEDQTLLGEVAHRVRETLTTVDRVYYHLMLRHINALRGMADPYLRERFLDIKDVTQRVMRHLRGELLETPMFDHPVIVVAHDLTPSDTVQLNRSLVLGFAMETGSAVSHAAIIACSMNVPAVARLAGLMDELHSGDMVLLDGDKGELILNPSEERLAELDRRKAAVEKKEDAFVLRCLEPAITRCGQVVKVGVNGEFLDEIAGLRACGAEEVGLFRTEFLHLADPDASEEWLTDAYRQVVTGMDPGMVIFRTLDLGGDKVDPGYQQDVEPNPFLGWRGIRVSLERQDLFRKQLRALLRAGAGRRIGIMFPMVTIVAEVIAARAILQECRDELAGEGFQLPLEVRVGAMIEVPGAALDALGIAEHVDFLSLGTNDLVQYTLAVDRLNDKVSNLYRSTHPAVLRLIEMTADAGRCKKVRVGICGEMASDVDLTPLLIGLGLRELSVAASKVPRIKHAIRQLSIADCQDLWQRARGSSDPEQILQLSREMASTCYPELVGD